MCNQIHNNVMLNRLLTWLNEYLIHSHMLRLQQRKYNRRSHVLRAQHLGPRRLPILLERLRVRRDAQQPRVHIPRLHRRDPQPRIRRLQPQRLQRRLDEELASRVDAQPGKHLAAGVRRYGHDVPAAALQEARHRRRQAVQQALAVDVDGALPLIRLGVGHHGKVHDARADDQHVDVAQLLRHRLHERLHLRCARYVRWHRQDLAAAARELGLDALEGVLAAGGERDVGALGCELGGHGGAHAGGCAGHDGNFSSQTALLHVRMDAVAVAIDLEATRRVWQPASGVKVPGIRLPQRRVNLGPLEAVEIQRWFSKSILENSDALQRIDRRHTTAENIHSERIIASSRPALLAPERNPLLPGELLSRVSQRIKTIKDLVCRDRAGVSQVVKPLLGVGVVGERDDGLADKVHRRHLREPAVDLGGKAKVERLDNDGVQEIVGVGRSSGAVATNGARSIHLDGDATSPSLIDQRFGHPLRLAVAIEELLRH
ncbi:hypothetical protein TOPH_08385 [Tolypocladium ophioglossoides CBS 100239]|uniref:Uncharacterized protein n=1 Tax=Tolypocladium ophioglossoides (strain CBS 100239) TaxID=1163406 RepID=A0A0L0MYW2_TOLOC|nr:hypothetical protein TOPH_08385 [Tolypocladium ophioglossoides CBS 100239]